MYIFIRVSDPSKKILKNIIKKNKNYFDWKLPMSKKINIFVNNECCSITEYRKSSVVAMYNI